ncbi:hypothetical protein LWI28_002873 [Acer negundo]|uniref:Disease resistance R13L4/SHOC-2-like LRR domain-containing protein n=1 Tax=Acer negundo TaxID=4023 RepID=A0AAD5JIQ7_ACENE|nr:hypothetical protein LWI28_002873 [Acer negundo]
MEGCFARSSKSIWAGFKRNQGSKAIQGISFDMSRTEYIDLNPCAFANMRNMRYLEFYCSNYNEKNENKVHVSKGLDSVFNELRYLHWYGCPFKSLQSNVNPEHLVILRMQDSNVEQLWNGVMQLVNLKEIDLSGSKHLISCPDLSGACNLEILDLGQCTSLLEISSSLQYLSKLDSLYLNGCKSLRGLPDCFSGLKSLRYLNMFGCSYLKMLPDMSCYIEHFDLSETAIEELSPAIENLSKLVVLSLHKCSRLKSLPSNICKLKSLEHLCLSYCPKIDKLPDEIGILESLKTLDVVETAIREVPSSIVHLNNLETNGLKDVVEDVLQKLESLATLWTKQPYKKHVKNLPWASICFPGNGRCHIVSGNFGYPPRDHVKPPYSVKSDHVYIGSDHLMYPRDTGDLCYNNLVTFQFYIVDRAGQRRIECCNVKSCGVRLMYAQDLGKSNGSFSFGEREDEPQPKRLKSI